MGNLDDHRFSTSPEGMMFFGQEFIEGAARLRGTAKALDVWRMETKVEVLFEEVLNLGFARISLVFPCVFFHEKRGINWENTTDPYESTRKGVFPLFTVIHVIPPEKGVIL